MINYCMKNQFKCLECGTCCREIVRIVDGVSAGLWLQPIERRIFHAFPGSVVPYLGLKRDGRAKIENIGYQMVQGPCPLLDPDTNRCKEYGSRPIMCRSYPFSFNEQGLSVDRRCNYIQSVAGGIEYGKTEMRCGFVQDNAVIESKRFYDSLQQLMIEHLKIHDRLNLLIYDCLKKDWIG
jgi:Fe-S-cluster containining protein